MKPIVFRGFHTQKENSHYDHVPLDLKGIRIRNKLERDFSDRIFCRYCFRIQYIQNSEYNNSEYNTNSEYNYCFDIVSDIVSEYCLASSDPKAY